MSNTIPLNAFIHSAVGHRVGEILIAFIVEQFETVSLDGVTYPLTERDTIVKFIQTPDFIKLLDVRNVNGVSAFKLRDRPLEEDDLINQILHANKGTEEMGAFIQLLINAGNALLAHVDTLRANYSPEMGEIPGMATILSSTVNTLILYQYPLAGANPLVLNGLIDSDIPMALIETTTAEFLSILSDKDYAWGK